MNLTATSTIACLRVIHPKINIENVPDGFTAVHIAMDDNGTMLRCTVQSKRTASVSKVLVMVVLESVVLSMPSELGRQSAMPLQDFR